MNKIIVIVMLFVMSSGAWAVDYEITWGDDNPGLDLFDYDTLLMTGGTAYYLNMGGWSTGIIEDTDPLNIAGGDGGIWEVEASSYSELTINDGEFYDLIANGYGTVNLHGGQIFGDLTIYNSTAWVHIFGYGFNNDPFLGSPLTGFWSGGTPFSINLVDDTISTYDQLIFHEIPEPASIILLGLGGLLLRKRKL
jgi:hypothetical protein